METVTSFDRYRATPARRRRVSVRPTFYFDLASPYTYLAAERVERLFTWLTWLPASRDALRCGASTSEREAVARRAESVGLPLVWPADPPARVLGAMRVASLATERGVGAAFVLAASRLAFCGGYDIDRPEILAEAAAAAGIELGEMLRAAGDARRDEPIAEAARLLVAAGADRLPAVCVSGRLFCGEDRLSEAAAATRAPA